MRRTLAIAGLIALIGAQAPLRAYTVEYNDRSGIVARRWLVRPIIVSFSTSLNSPPANIKEGSDVVGAARRALAHWSDAADIVFLETVSNAQSISPHNAGDRVNLITVSADNAAAFGSTDTPGRTRLFYDSGGAIVEGDIALNPNQLFSTDGTPGTFDLESTFTHEIGHLLGLEHSGVIGATMQPRQAMNGVYGLPAFTQRSLSDDDVAGVRTLYGSRAGTGTVSGRLIVNGPEGGSRPVFGGQVFVEDALTGRVVGSSVTMASGEYRIEALNPGNYRLIGQSLRGPVAGADIASTGGSYSALRETTPAFRSFMAANSSAAQSVDLASNAALSFDSFVSGNPEPALRARVIGMNGELSTVALPLEGGKTFRVYVGGDGVDQISAAGISISSSFMTIVPDSLQREEFETPYPVISFEVRVAVDVLQGDYSIRLESTDGEFIYLPGAITIESSLPDVEQTIWPLDAITRTGIVVPPAN
jgi:Matrixin